MTTIFDTYRNGGGLEERVKEAVGDFHHRYGKLPSLVIVHKSQAGAVREIVRDGLEVRGLGGCLSNEVWLQKPEEQVKIKQKRLL